MKNSFLFPALRVCQQAVAGFASSPLCKSLPVQLTLIVFATVLASCGTVQVYKETDQPLFYSSEKALPASKQRDSLGVVTFNIKKCEKPQLAATELSAFQQTRKVDVYL